MPETFAFYTFAAIAVGESVLDIGQMKQMNID
jgi:hypothetical protein